MRRLRTALAALVLAAGTVVAGAPAATAAPNYCPQDVRFGGVYGQKTYTPDTFCLYALALNSTGDAYVGEFLVFQRDGNLVEYVTGRARWSSGTAGRGARLALQQDGNVVIYDAGGRPLWWTNTGGGFARHLVQQYDGNVVIYEGEPPRAMWATNTRG